jgi:hypothetical protein
MRPGVFFEIRGCAMDKTDYPRRPDFESKLRLHAMLDLMLTRATSASPPASGSELFELVRRLPGLLVTTEKEHRNSLATLIDAGVIEQTDGGNFWYGPLESLHFSISQYMQHLFARHASAFQWKPRVPTPAKPRRDRKGKSHG